MAWKMNIAMCKFKFVLFFFILACGEEKMLPEDTQLCNNINTMRVAYNLAIGGTHAAEEAFLLRQGGAFLYISGTCEYWAFNGSSEPNRLWSPVFTGVLSEEQSQFITNNLALERWRELSDSELLSSDPPVRDGSGYYFLFDDNKFGCRDICNSLGREFIATVHSTIESLSDAGSEVDASKVRVLVFPLSETYDDLNPYIRDDLSVAHLSDSVDEEPPTYEKLRDGKIISDDNLVSRFKRERDLFRNRDQEKYWADQPGIIVNEDGRFFQLYILDVLENERLIDSL